MTQLIRGVGLTISPDIFANLALTSRRRYKARVSVTLNLSYFFAFLAVQTPAIEVRSTFRNHKRVFIKCVQQVAVLPRVFA